MTVADGIGIICKNARTLRIKCLVLFQKLYEYKINSTYKRAEILVVLLLIYVNVALSLSVLYACKQDIFNTYQRRSTIVLYYPFLIETIKQCFYSCQYTTPPINYIHINMINWNGSFAIFVFIEYNSYSTKTYSILDVQTL